MIQLNRNYNPPEKSDDEIPIKVVGVGDAGSNVLDRIVLDGLNKADLIAINTDVQSLASSVAAHKVQPAGRSGDPWPWNWGRSGGGLQFRLRIRG